MYKAIIFDFDGVLASSTESYVKAYRKILEANNMKLDDENELKSHFGKPVPDIIAEYAKKEGKSDDVQKITEEFHKEISGKWFKGEMKLLPKVGDVLAKLKKEGFLLAIASGTRTNMLMIFLEHLKIKKYFDVVLGATDVKNGKPDPEIAIRALECLGVKAQDALYIGDAKSDVLVAKGAGIASAIVLTGVLNRKEAERLSPDYILKDLGEIWEILGKADSKQ